MSSLPPLEVPRSTRARAGLLALATLGVTLALAPFWPDGRAEAVSTARFVLDRPESLAAGELVRTTVHSDGRVTAGAELRRIGLPDDVPLVYSSARAADGTIYLGTGNDGRVYRLRGDDVELHAETGQLLVSALAIGEGGALYAGTLPEGRIYRIEGGQVSEFARPDDAEHVWALEWDARRGVLFAGTGPDGNVHAITRAGQVSRWWESPAGHIMSLALAPDGTLYAGTSDDALVARITGPGRVEIVHDFPGNEITALAVRDGALAVAANEFPDPPSLAPSPATKRTGAARAPRPRPGKGRLFRVGADARVEQVYEQNDGHFACVELHADGTIYAGAGAEGRIIRVASDRASATHIDVEERQVLDLSLEGDSPYFVTGDGAALYRVVAGRPRNAIWQSKVLDAQFVSRFGQLVWRGEGQLVFQTRSGNTETPDATWSDWSQDLARSGPVRSAPARFLQIRARFDRDPDAVLHAVTVYFLPQNQRATVSDVVVKVGNEAAQKRARAERQTHVPDAANKLKLTWSVNNPDDDRLRYRLRYREEGQRVWRQLLREGEVLTETEYLWRTEAVPDGHYIVEVEASDELDNPSTLALRHVGRSAPILVDNHPPRVEELRFAGGLLRGRARDALGPIARLEMAIDGGDWEPIFPVDDILDTADERFEVDLSARPAGEYIVAIRATDAAGNTGSAEAQIRIGP